MEIILKSGDSLLVKVEPTTQEPTTQNGDILNYVFNGTVGQPATNDFLEAYNTTYSDDLGEVWGKCIATQGSNSGFGGRFPENFLKEGDTRIIEWDCFFPRDFDFTASGGALKFMRQRVKSQPYSTDGGYVDIYINSATKGLRYHNELANTATDTMNDSTLMLGQPNKIKLLVRFSSVNPLVQLWLNDSPVHEDKTTPTCTEQFKEVTDVLYFSYWNGNAPKNQASYIRNVTITNVRG